ncbi:MAG TPA: D-glycerate dehydrogenase [Nitrososphaeraceae archaeon]|jgi:glyoxylate reductase|nr:D-glycerate dehydrogenase [Nitrososphaeraceae archaeon]
MERKKIFITRKINSIAVELLKNYYDVILTNKTDSPTKNVMIKKVKNVYGILCTLSEKIDSDIMDAAGSNLKVISTLSTGYEHIDIGEATKRGIYVTTTGNILSEATADLTFGLILALSRKIVEGHLYVIDGKWQKGWAPDLFLGSNIYGSTLGILGLGNIGTAVAKRANGFNMNIIYTNRHQLSKSIENKLNVTYVTFDQLLKNSDFLSIHTSFDKDNFHLIDSIELKKMKKTSFLINTSRGSIINEISLIKALKNKWIAGAGLDVFEKEPLPNQHELLKLKNVILLPHIGSATVQTRNQMSEVAAINLHNILSKKKPLYLVNRELLQNLG